MYKSILKNPQTSTESYDSENEKASTAPKKPERLRDFDHISSPTQITSKNLWATRDPNPTESPNSKYDGSLANLERKSISNPRPETLNIDETDSLRRPRPHTLVLKQSNAPSQTRNINREEPEQTRIQNQKELGVTRQSHRAVSDHSDSDQDTVPDNFPIRSAQAERDESRPSSVLKVQVFSWFSFNLD